MTPTKTQEVEYVTVEYCQSYHRIQFWLLRAVGAILAVGVPLACGWAGLEWSRVGTIEKNQQTQEVELKSHQAAQQIQMGRVESDLREIKEDIKTLVKHSRTNG